MFGGTINRVSEKHFRTSRRSLNKLADEQRVNQSMWTRKFHLNTDMCGRRGF